MLGKLIKHEWKSTSKVGGLMLIIMLLITFFGWLSFQSPMWQSLSNDSVTAEFGIWDVLSIFTLMMYVFMLVGVTYGIMIYLAVHFYKTMYTDEGYLIHTLPVTKHQILGSKIFVSGLWYMLIGLAVYLSLFILIGSIFAAAIPDEYSLARIWQVLKPELGTIFEVFKEELGIDLGVMLAYVIVVTFISPFTAMAIIFGAITLGQLFSKHRVLMAIVSYICVYVVNMLVASIIQSVSSMSMINNVTSTVEMGSYMNTTMIGSLVLSLVEAVVLYIVAHYINSKKLNME